MTPLAPPAPLFPYRYFIPTHLPQSHTRYCLKRPNFFLCRVAFHIR